MNLTTSRTRPRTSCLMPWLEQTRGEGEGKEAKQRRVLTDHNVLSHISLDRNPHISRVGQHATSKPVWEWVLISMIERLSESDLRTAFLCSSLTSADCALLAHFLSRLDVTSRPGLAPPPHESGLDFKGAGIVQEAEPPQQKQSFAPPREPSRTHAVCALRTQTRAQRHRDAHGPTHARGATLGPTQIPCCLSSQVPRIFLATDA